MRSGPAFDGDLDVSFAENISSWRNQLQTFFKQDWDELRRIVLQLEEQSWASETQSMPEPVPVNTQQSTSRDQRFYNDIDPDSSSSARIESAADTVTRSRLDELAENIELRIRSAQTRLK